MDTSSGEDLVIKSRKPYTITKQRERWTEEEHDRFLEALKLYGRAWQRIEEHIGTKTAVQIRSHAQKFFSKLEKEANAKGVPIEQAVDIDIPPPRPKRKPSNPYPRKTGTAAPISKVEVKDRKLMASVSSLCSQQGLELEKEPLAEVHRDGKPSSAKDNLDDSFPEATNHGHEARSSSISSVDKNCTPAKKLASNSCTIRECAPSVVKAIQNNEKHRKSGHLGDDLIPSVEKDGLVEELPPDDMQGTHSYPRHIPVHVLNGSTKNGIQTPLDASLQESTLQSSEVIHEQSNMSENFKAPTAMGGHQNNVPKSSDQSFPQFHPIFTHTNHIQDYCKTFPMASSIYNLIISALLQNPAAHAAASFAASFWPNGNVASSVELPTEGGFPSEQVNTAPDMAAIAAATIAAAASWWAAHGLLPLCPPFPAAFTNPHLLTEDSVEKEGTNLNTEQKATDTAALTELEESTKMKNRKQVDRSSCGSNTGSSCEETDAFEKHEEGTEDVQEDDVNCPVLDSSFRRPKSNNYMNDSWKEVSEGGRVAFRALFSRERLPQSFSPSLALKSNEDHKDEQNTNESSLDLIRNIGGSLSDNHQADNGEALLTLGLGQGSFQHRRTGFKPYKRCSVEAIETREVNSGQAEEDSRKRIRLEREVLNKPFDNWMQLNKENFVTAFRL